MGSKQSEEKKTKERLFVSPGSQRRKRRPGTQGEATDLRWGWGFPARFRERYPCIMTFFPLSLLYPG